MERPTRQDMKGSSNFQKYCLKQGGSEEDIPHLLSQMLSNLLLASRWPMNPWMVSSIWVSLLSHRTGQRRAEHGSRVQGSMQWWAQIIKNMSNYLLSWSTSPAPESVCPPRAAVPIHPSQLTSAGTLANLSMQTALPSLLLLANSFLFSFDKYSSPSVNTRFA